MEKLYAAELIWKAGEASGIFGKLPDTARLAKFLSCFDAMKDKKDPPKLSPNESWRERNRRRQAAGVKFQFNTGDKQRIQWENKFCDFSGNEEDYREVQEAPKKGDVNIPEAARNILISWQRSGLKFFVLGDPANFSLFFDGKYSRYTIPEQPIPTGMSVETVEAMWRQGLRIEYNHYGKAWRDVVLETEWNRGLFEYAEILQCLRIPAQPIPNKLLEVPQEVSGAEYASAAQLNPTIPHLAERILWLQQREAGTDEVWQFIGIGNVWLDCVEGKEPEWLEACQYRVKPKTVKCYVVAIKASITGGKEDVKNFLGRHCITIIGDIEEREVEV